MHKVYIREVTVYSIGDSRKYSTWSNVPYFFTESLIAKGVKVNRVNLKPFVLAEVLFNNLIKPALKKINKDTTYEYFRTGINFFHQKQRIKNGVKKYGKSDAHIFMTFSFSWKHNSKEKVFLQFGDWSYDYYLNCFHKAAPDVFEKASIDREIKQIKDVDGVFCLFPGPCEYIKQHHRENDIYYLGNVINCCCEPIKSEIEEYKRESKILLFIGNYKYKQGALSLINACKNRMIKRYGLSVHIIGMSTSELGKDIENVVCHGYLNKDIPYERERYYALLKKARIVVNTNPIWAGFSSIVEAMYFYTPVIVYPFDEFKKTFGGDIPFGVYCNNSEDDIRRAILQIMNSNNYEQLCEQAFDAVKEFGWDSYCTKFLKKASKILKRKNDS